MSDTNNLSQEPILQASKEFVSKLNHTSGPRFKQF